MLEEFRGMTVTLDANEGYFLFVCLLRMLSNFASKMGVRGQIDLGSSGLAGYR